MIEKLSISPSEETPEVLFDACTQTFMLKGRSFPEDSHLFYKPLLDWFEKYSRHPCDKTHLEIQLDYFNSGSVKKVFNLLFLVEDLKDAGNEAQVIWKYKKGDELSLQKGLEFKSFLEIPVEIVEI